MSKHMQYLTDFIMIQAEEAIFAIQWNQWKETNPWIHIYIYI